MKNIFDYELIELDKILTDMGEASYRGKQIFKWLYGAHKNSRLERQIKGFGEMTNLPKPLLSKLSEEYEIYIPKVIEVQKSKLDGTQKFLLGMRDGNAVESVLMSYKYGNSICISSQAGCRMGCKFCASTLNGLIRNLTAGEIIGQIISVETATGVPINHVVIMGTGEPFDNYEEVGKFIRIINSKEGFDLGMRNITVSTCGIVPMIHRFAEDFPQVNLAISLHSGEDKLRSDIMPINKKYGIDELIQGCKDYIAKTNRRVTFEYTLIKDVNDDEKSANMLAQKLKGLNCHVNLISLNSVDEVNLRGASSLQVFDFQKLLLNKGINTTIRRKLGMDIDGACGQLRLKSKNNFD